MNNSEIDTVLSSVANAPKLKFTNPKWICAKIANLLETIIWISPIVRRNGVSFYTAIIIIFSKVSSSNWIYVHITFVDCAKYLRTVLRNATSIRRVTKRISFALRIDEQYSEDWLMFCSFQVIDFSSFLFSWIRNLCICNWYSNGNRSHQLIKPNWGIVLHIFAAPSFRNCAGKISTTHEFHFWIVDSCQSRWVRAFVFLIVSFSEETK